MNNKGQALVEFIMILPIFMFILFVIIDFGIIFSTKLTLENDSEDIVSLVYDGKSIYDIENMYKDIDISVDDYGDELLKVSINKNINVMTPGLDRILGNPYKISVERIINNETAWK